MNNRFEVKFREQIFKIDHLWLRDHCRCELCYNHSTFQRRISILEIPNDISPVKFEVRCKNFYVKWIDGHESLYDVNFLERNLSREEKLSEKILWTHDVIQLAFKNNFRVSVNDYMTNPNKTAAVLKNLYHYGVTFIEGVQPNQESTEMAIKHLFDVQKTLFGEMWTFSDENQDHSDTAYTNYYLGAHNDNTYYNDAAGLQILHCILENCTGGENFLIDGFQVANKLKNTHPDVFQRLTTRIVATEFIESGRHHKYAAPIIRLNESTGEVLQIRFNDSDRAPLNTQSVNNVRQFYNDFKILASEMENKDNQISFKLKPGTVMIFDNWRILHGRGAYKGQRKMTGCYVSRTDFESVLRVNGIIS